MRALRTIEDIFNADDVTPQERVNNRQFVTARSRNNKPVTNGDGVHSNGAVEGTEESIIPGTQTIYVKTWGCTHNNSDSE
eukprot:UN02218